MSAGLDGSLAPPMANGEVVFEAPWQGRLFGMAHALAGAGVFSWDDFRASLVEELARWDREPEGDFAYYEYFQRALEGVLAARGVVGSDALAERCQALRARAPGHDHGHGHEHATAHDQSEHAVRPGGVGSPGSSVP